MTFLSQLEPILAAEKADYALRYAEEKAQSAIDDIEKQQDKLTRNFESLNSASKKAKQEADEASIAAERIYPYPVNEVKKKPAGSCFLIGLLSAALAFLGLMLIVCYWIRGSFDFSDLGTDLGGTLIIAGIGAFIAFLVGFFVPFSSSRDKHHAREMEILKESMRLRSLRYAYVEETLSKASKTISRNLKKMKTITNERAALLKPLTMYMELRAQIVTRKEKNDALLEELYGYAGLAAKHKGFVPVSMFCDYLRQGRCESAAECYQLYEEEKAAKRIYGTEKAALANKDDIRESMDSFWRTVTDVDYMFMIAHRTYHTPEENAERFESVALPIVEKLFKEAESAARKLRKAMKNEAGEDAPKTKRGAGKKGTPHVPAADGASAPEGEDVPSDAADDTDETDES